MILQRLKNNLFLCALTLSVLLAFGGMFFAPEKVFADVTPDEARAAINAQNVAAGHSGAAITDQEVAAYMALHATTQAGQETAAQNQAAYGDSSGITCGDVVLAWRCWLVGIVEFFFLKIPILLASIVGQLFDVITFLSLRGETYSGYQSLIDTTWKIVRDFLNIFFIGALIWIALRTILDIGANTQKLLVSLVVAALVMNFSLFATRVAIDASNLVGNVFYDALTGENANSVVGTKGGLWGPNNTVAPKGIPSMSLSVVKSFNPQTLLIGNHAVIDKKTWTGIATAYVMSGIINIIMIFVFLALAWIFIVRTVTLILLCITSPIPIIASIIPYIGAQKAKKQWLETLIGQVLVAPVFLFLMYIVIILSQKTFAINFSDQGATDDGFITTVLAIVVPMLLVLYGLMKSASIAKELSVKGAGAVVGGVLGKAAGFALGGVGGLALRRTLGLAGTAAKDSAWIKNLSENKVAKYTGLSLATRTLANRASSATFDINQSKLGKELGFKETGIAKTLGLGGSKGYEKDAAASAKKIDEQAKWLGKGEGGKERKKEYEARMASRGAGTVGGILYAGAHKRLEDKVVKETEKMEKDEKRMELAKKRAPLNVEKASLEKIQKEKKQAYEDALEELAEAKRMGDESPRAQELTPEVEKAKKEFTDATAEVENIKQKLEDVKNEYVTSAKPKKDEKKPEEKKGNDEKKDEKK